MMNHIKLTHERARVAPLPPGMTDPGEQASPRGDPWSASGATLSGPGALAGKPVGDGDGRTFSAEQQRALAQLVQHAMAPFMGELGRVREELGSERERRLAAEESLAAMAERSIAAEKRALTAEWQVRLLRGELIGASQDNQNQQRRWPWSRR